MRKISAITFIELLVVIIIIGILAGVSIPQFRKTFNNLQLKSFSRDLQSFMNYLQQRSIVEQKIIYLNIDIDNEKKEYWAQIKDAKLRLKAYPIPKDIDVEIKKSDAGIEVNNKQILFYPDGQIEGVTIEITSLDNPKIALTTEGVFGKVKIKSSE